MSWEDVEALERVGAMQILVVEDHPKLCELIVSTIVRDGKHEASGVNTVPDARDLLEKAARLPDVALVDLNLRGESGIQVIELLSERGVPCLALTIADDSESVLGALRAGARGYLLKSDAPGDILRAIDEVADGRNPISSAVTSYLLPAADDRREQLEQANLTDREEEVLITLAKGLTYEECADSLDCALGTIQTHVKRLYAKLGVNSKTEACAWAFSVGLVE